ncbi:hypothetical protein [Paraburkholderia sp. SIMBA_054]|uniref:hypothetical protein n=1 Tax=Paraburkholderia sp. SIMBA_054 TaxID=3085795 RepID=UPI0039786C7D
MDIETAEQMLTDTIKAMLECGKYQSAQAVVARVPARDQFMNVTCVMFGGSEEELNVVAARIVDHSGSEPVLPTHVALAGVTEQASRQPGLAVDDPRHRALSLAGRALIRIRVLSRCAQDDSQRHEARLQLIERLADSAHNLPQLVLTLGEDAWATHETLASEIGLCETALREAASFKL